MTFERLSGTVIRRYIERLAQELDAPVRMSEPVGTVQMTGTYKGHRVTVNIQTDEERSVMLAYAEVGQFAKDDDRRAYWGELFSALAMSPADTYGMSVSVNPVDGCIYLVASLIGPETEYILFYNVVLKLFAIATFWQKKLQEQLGA